MDSFPQQQLNILLRAFGAKVIVEGNGVTATRNYISINKSSAEYASACKLCDINLANAGKEDSEGNVIFIFNEAAAELINIKYRGFLNVQTTKG